MKVIAPDGMDRPLFVDLFPTIASETKVIVLFPVMYNEPVPDLLHVI